MDEWWMNVTSYIPQLYERAYKSKSKYELELRVIDDWFTTLYLTYSIES